MYLFPFVFIAAVIFSNIIKSSQKNSAASLEAFWEREAQANTAPQKDIDNLNYITISLNALPFIANPSKNIKEYEDTIRRLASCRILNLNGITNTDLKLTYGVQNFTRLSRYDENFSLMQRTFAAWGNALRREGYREEAVMVLEYALELTCDARSIFINLKELYAELGIERLDQLILAASVISSPLKDSIISELNRPYTPPCTDD